MKLIYKKLLLFILFSGFLLLPDKTFAMTVKDFLFKPSTDDVSLRVEKQSGDLGSSHIVIYSIDEKGEIKDVLGRDFENLGGRNDAGFSGLPNSGKARIIIYNCTSNACSGPLGLGGGGTFNDDTKKPNGTYREIFDKEIYLDSVYCYGDCPKEQGKEYSPESDFLVIHHYNPYDPGVCGDGNYAAYVEVDKKPVKLGNYDMIQESGKNKCRIEVGGIKTTAGKTEGTTKISYYWTEYAPGLTSTPYTKNQSGSYLITSFTLDLEKGTTKKEQGELAENVSVECELSGSKEPGVYTAIGCLPTSPTGIVNWLSIFGFYAGGALVVFRIIQGSALMMTATGNPDMIQEARGIITSAIIGLLVLISGAVLLQFIGVTVLGLDSFGFISILID